MAAIGEMLKTQMEKSRNFPQENFGLKVGKEWPDFVREILASKEVKQELTLGFLMSMLMGSSMQKKMEGVPKDDPSFMEKIAEDSIVYENPLKFLFWGIQIGKQLAEVQQLEEMAK